MNLTRVLVIGAGSISREYALHHFTPSTTNTVVVGIVDPDLGKAKTLAIDVGSAQAGVKVDNNGNKYQSRMSGTAGVAVPAFSSLQDALAHTNNSGDEHSFFDLVYIGTPPSSHRSLVEDALEHGKNVLLEKPLASTPSDADAIVRASDLAFRSSGAILGMNIGMRYNAALQELKRRILINDELDIAAGEGRGGQQLLASLKLHFRQWPREWQTQPWCAGRKDGGPCREVGTHFLAALLEFASSNPDEKKRNVPAAAAAAGSAVCDDKDGMTDRRRITARVKATVLYPEPSPASMVKVEVDDPCEVSATGTIELMGGVLPPKGLVVDVSVLTNVLGSRDIYELEFWNKGSSPKPSLKDDDSLKRDKSLTLFDFCSLRNQDGEILVQNADYGRRECVRAVVASAGTAFDTTRSSVMNEEDEAKKDIPSSRNSDTSLVTVRDGRNAQRLLDAVLQSNGEWIEVEMDQQ